MYKEILSTLQIMEFDIGFAPVKVFITTILISLLSQVVLTNDDQSTSHLETIVLGAGCFWGAEKLFWQQHGVYSTSVGYTDGYTKNPTYQEVCSGNTGHTEAVLVVYDPTILSLKELLRIFWEGHDPTQYMRQGNDIGTQYRSAVFFSDEMTLDVINQTKQQYQKRLIESGRGSIVTEIKPLKEFFFAEDYHQQYLAKNPNGYCGLGGTGVCLEG